MRCMILCKLALRFTCRSLPQGAGTFSRAAKIYYKMTSVASDWLGIFFAINFRPAKMSSCPLCPWIQYQYISISMCHVHTIYGNTLVTWLHTCRYSSRRPHRHSWSLSLHQDSSRRCITSLRKVVGRKRSRYRSRKSESRFPQPFTSVLEPCRYLRVSSLVVSRHSLLTLLNTVLLYPPSLTTIMSMPADYLVEAEKALVIPSLHRDSVREVYG